MFDMWRWAVLNALAMKFHSTMAVFASELSHAIKDRIGDCHISSRRHE
jgi:hypothetical protein